MKIKNIIIIVLYIILSLNCSLNAAPAELFGTSLIADISEKVSSAVVSIESIHYVREKRHYGSGDPFFDKFFAHLFDDDFSGYNNVIPQKGNGSGVLINKDGYVLTNEHVISGSDEIIVKFNDDKTTKAKIVGKDKNSDLAVLKIDEKEVSNYIKLGNSDSVRVGECVIAIGNPFGLGITVTCGVISAIKRDLSIDKETCYKDLLQTDASINPGNSGGALINSKGELIGINTAIIPSGQGIGFAIPINRAKKVVEDIIKFGKVKKVFTGVSVQEITQELADYFNIPTNGVLVNGVKEGSIAEKVGIYPGDVIQKINGNKLRNSSDFEYNLEKMKIGDIAKFEILRKGKTGIINIKLDERIADKNILGLEVKTNSDKYINKYGLFIEKGCVIIDINPESTCYKMGLRVGDVIIKIDDELVLNEEDFLKKIEKYKKSKSIYLQVIRNSTIARVKIDLL